MNCIWFVVCAFFCLFHLPVILYPRICLLIWKKDTHNEINSINDDWKINKSEMHKPVPRTPNGPGNEQTNARASAWWDQMFRKWRCGAAMEVISCHDWCSIRKIKWLIHMQFGCTDFKYHEIVLNEQKKNYNTYTNQLHFYCRTGKNKYPLLNELVSEFDGFYFSLFVHFRMQIPHWKRRLVHFKIHQQLYAMNSW